jgi:hypothetical protein
VSRRGFQALRAPASTSRWTRSDQVSSRLDTKAVKQFLGDAWRKFETASITTVIRIKSVERLASASAA